MRARPLARQPTLIAIRRTVRAADMLPAPAAARSRRWPPTRMANRPLAQLIPPRRIPMLRARRRRPAGMCHARATVARCRAAARRATAHRQAATEQTALRRHPAAPTADRRRTTAACPVTAPALRRPTTMPRRPRTMAPARRQATLAALRITDQARRTTARARPTTGPAARRVTAAGPRPATTAAVHPVMAAPRRLQARRPPLEHRA